MITKFKTSTDFRKSLENRLKNLANPTDHDLQRLRRTVAFDRLLARLLDANDTPFVLKGGYAMELRFSNARATKDIDLILLLVNIRSLDFDRQKSALEQVFKVRKTHRLPLNEAFSRIVNIYEHMLS